MSRSPVSVPKDAIAGDGRHIAYISREKEDPPPEPFIQRLRTGSRLAWSPVRDPADERRFQGSSVRYVSGSDRLLVDLDDVARAIKVKFGP